MLIIKICLYTAVGFLQANTAQAADVSGTATGVETPATAPSSNGGESQIYLKVGEANVKKSLLALPPIQNQSAPGAGGLGAGKEIYDVLANDLSVSGYFDFVDEAAFKHLAKDGLKPAPAETNGFSFDAWKTIGAEFLIRGGYRLVDGKITLEAYVYYVPQRKLAMGKSYRANAGDARALAHAFANDVVKALTGKRGPFISKIVAARSTLPQEKEIFVMDWDGAGARQISKDKSIALSPAWAPDGKSVIYTAFAYHASEKKRNIDLFQYDLTNGKRWLLSYRPGINSGGNFFPDGRSLLLTVSQGGNPDIFKMTLDGKSLERITDGPRGALNVEPAVHPNSDKFAFSSDRSGQPMLYSMNIDGSGLKRLTFAGKYNATPAWSPDGKRIAFAGYDAGHFDIFIMDAEGSNMSRLTSAKKQSGKMANNENPTFSPDGRLIMFASDRTGVSQLYVTTTDGANEHRITFDKHNYFKPQWSPYLD